MQEQAPSGIGSVVEHSPEYSITDGGLGYTLRWRGMPIHAVAVQGDQAEREKVVAALERAASHHSMMIAAEKREGEALNARNYTEAREISTVRRSWKQRYLFEVEQAVRFANGGAMKLRRRRNDRGIARSA